ncbi:MAG: nucleotidyltransferase domain-containing protein [Ruminococcus sp.]|nr:nucleotidyltransferase domain-containing protein [Ruminococcus sp.]
MSDRIYTLNEIKNIIAPIAARYGVDKVYLFGSYARGDADESSDIDLCIDAVALRGLFALGSLYADLEDALGKELDLITVKSLKYNNDNSFKDSLQKERVLIYEAA